MRRSRYINNLIQFLIVIFSTFYLNSCSSVLTCEVQGKPGTEIYRLNGNYLGIIDGSGKTKIRLPRNYRHDMIYAKETRNSPIIPIGLNYSKRANMEFLAGTASLIAVPVTFGLSVYGMSKYYDYADVKDLLKLNKQQNSNTDLTKLIYSSPNPIDEIKNLPVRQHKHGKKSNKKNTETSWINKNGSIKKISKAYVDLIGDKKDIKISDDLKIEFSFFEDFDNKMLDKSYFPPTILFSGTINNEKFNYTINLKETFKEEESGYLAINKKDNSPVKIISLSPDQSLLSFEYQTFLFNFVFDINSFEAGDNTYDKNSVLRLLFDQ